ncbi:MAG: Fe-S cluster assembly protein SufD [Bacteroidetes bacterium GWF2_38_335]|nr:MAG: Fe-S cluster assembly protein SufD [Bacteroidetes bacterium GWF2_38_335]OFY77960.1 MAG: Fe-S cluster assembly protein SufD [Bacteroidetes bacterium RIFOXYA12_FULL_38_20]HBS86701.1 Fe-S cluster assembly protein SufD [Bacteroidales bacterium]
MENQVLADINTIFIDRFKNEKSVLCEGSSELINSHREKAFEIFQKTGIPTKADERYRYITLDPVFRVDYKSYLRKRDILFNIDDVFHCDVPNLETHTILLVNGWYHDKENQLTSLPGGAVIGSFMAAAQKYPRLFEKYYGKYADPNTDGLTALNTAFAQDGIFLYVPKGVILDKSIQIINILLSDEDVMAQPRNLFILEENSQAQIVVCDHTLSSQRFLTNSVTEIAAGKNSLFDFYKIQNEHNGSVQLSSVFINQKKASNVVSGVITLHGGIIRNNIHVKLEEEYCENSTMGLYLSDKGQHVDNYTFIDHASPNCTSNELFKGVLDDYATGAFTGKILVRKDAQNTRAFQANNNILLTDDAKINTKPQLEIWADDVKCSHGATVGQLDDNALFYLRSRGINEKEARMLLMFGFTYEIMNKIKIEPLKIRISNLIEKRLRGELSRCNSCVMNCREC